MYFSVRRVSTYFFWFWLERFYMLPPIHIATSRSTRLLCYACILLPVSFTLQPRFAAPWPASYMSRSGSSDNNGSTGQLAV